MRYVELRRVVVTGLGAVSPNGHGREAFRRAHRDGDQRRPAGSRSSTRRSSGAGSPATIRGVDLTRAMEPRQLKLVSRMVPLAILAAREALEDAGLPPTGSTWRRAGRSASCSGPAAAAIEFIEAMYGHYYAGQARAGHRSSPCRPARTATARRRSRSSSACAGRRTSSRPAAPRAPTPSATPSAGSSTARAPWSLAGGADAPIAPGIMTGFDVMGITAPGAGTTSRRAPAARSTSTATASSWARGPGCSCSRSASTPWPAGLKIYGEVLGYASTCDAWHRVALSVDLDEPVRAIELALADAGVRPRAARLRQPPRHRHRAERPGRDRRGQAGPGRLRGRRSRCRRPRA